MNKYLFIIASFVLVVVRSNAINHQRLKAVEYTHSKKSIQAFNITSLDGKNEMVYVLSPFMGNELKIYYHSDTISVTNVQSMEGGIKILNKKFIEIKYQVFSGSNENSENSILLCVDKKRLFNALNINSLSSYDNINDHGIFKTMETLKGNNKKTYKLNVEIHQDAYSKLQPLSSYNYDNLSVLSFDETRNVFYSVKKDLYENFTMDDEKTDKQYKQKIAGNYPVIIIGDYNYYFIKGAWYEVGRDNCLIKYSSSNK